MAAPRDASSPAVSILTTTQFITAIDAAADGTIYVDQTVRPSELQRFRLPTRDPERIEMPAQFRASAGHVLPLQDGRFVIHAIARGRNQLMVKSGGAELTAFVQTDEETSGPLALVGRSLAAFVLGSGSICHIALASLSDGRIVRRIVSVGSDTVAALSASPDGQRVYFVRSGQVWTTTIDGAEPRKLHPGDAVSVDPSDGSIVILINQADGVRLQRLSSTGEESDIPLPTDRDGTARADW
jgi:hypothetical protein